VQAAHDQLVSALPEHGSKRHAAAQKDAWLKALLDKGAMAQVTLKNALGKPSLLSKSKLRQVKDNASFFEVCTCFLPASLMH
jgi:hypothetical protein